MAFSTVIFLPFNNYTGNETLDYMFYGMHDAWIWEAGKIRALQITSKISANSYRKIEKSIQEIGAEMHSDAAIETSVFCFG